MTLKSQKLSPINIFNINSLNLNDWKAMIEPPLTFNLASDAIKDAET